MAGDVPTVIKPPEIVDHTDDDQPSEYLEYRKVHGYPPKDCNDKVVEMEIKHAQRVSLIKAMKAVMLALIGAISILIYTWMLLVT